MKYGKYLVFVVLLIIFSVNTIYAQTCYYQTSEVSLEYESDSNKFTIRQRENKTNIIADNEPLINKKMDKTDSSFTGITVPMVSTECPAYVVYRRKHRTLWPDSDGIWGFNNPTDAQAFVKASKEIENMNVWSSPKQSITQEQFENNIIENANNYKKDGSAIGINPNANYGGTGIDVSDQPMSCGELFDPSLIELINDILKYPKYIVPGIILVLGTLDFLKAVLAGKEDEMKKAQKTFIKRVIIGVCVFLVPVLINGIIWLANIAWEGLGYTTCSL